MSTMADVARLANVSLSTVSHVVNGTRPVSEHVRKRVLDAIRETGYRQDTLARALRRSRTDSIGLVVSDAGEPAFAEMVHGVEAAAAKHSMTLLLANSAEDPGRELRAVRTLVERRVDGLVLARCAESGSDLTAYLEAGSPPLVLLDRVHNELDVDQVGVDNREAMASLVGRLLEEGHRRLVLAAGDTRVPTLRERRDGAVEAARGRASGGGIVVVEGAGDISQGLRRAMEDARPSCLLASSTPLAVQLLTVMGELGLSTPRDVAVAVFDGFTHGDLFTPSLTTVHQPAFDMGWEAVEMLVARIAADDGPVPGSRTVRLRHTIEWRESTEGWSSRKG